MGVFGREDSLENYIQMLDLMSMFSREELLDMKQELVKIMGMDI